jgi:hypothetical protein
MNAPASRYREVRRGLIVAVAVGLVCFGLTVAFVPVTSARAATPVPQTSPTYTPPFTGSVSTTWAYAVAGCASAKLAVGPHFSLASGDGGWESSAHAHACATAADNAGDAGGEFQALITMNFATSGMQTFTAMWNISQTYHEALTAGECIAVGGAATYSCIQESEINAYACGYVVDDTTGAILNGTGNSTCTYGIFEQQYDNTDCVSGICTVTAGGAAALGRLTSATYKVSLFGTVNAADTYSFDLWIYGEASAVIEHSAGAAILGPASAAARINIGSPTVPGDGASLWLVT